MLTALKSAAESYLRAQALSRARRNEHLTTVRKREKWGHAGPVEPIRRQAVREFLD